ncbi:PilN domain-containing protein [Halomonas sp. McH1-25]|uniref:PilN domain-containing protein n=1 Tax=unclassified Halomonas TaxID=2609666 RepID=UPI001EF5B927|nr:MULTISPECIES: PilN domain-containing protein [unclassified Halomonas]MCG7601427.1 PilN domain-containing protein [Halomonas sp. McH1-25]MCP1341968.1 PilN domain-containing protein [Halomonas sp. FL8]MCP1362897.1 PilN domain-containing protein [Halomonas sp. BBD45]MCP1363890.1 PilN domain-containing protein [Halomonas sp. BBD48]
MTIDINLLPWREAQRERHSRRFLIILSLAALLGAAGAWGLSLWYEQALDVQRQRNDHVVARMQQLNKDLEAIEDYQVLRERMLAQIELISELQASRPQTVRVFNQLVTSLEEGVYYTHLARKGHQLAITGLAQTNRQVSDQMRALAATEVFATPTLSEVQAEESSGRRRFDMSVEEAMSAVNASEGEATP